MVNASSAAAHFIKLLVTGACMICLGDFQSLKEPVWSVRAFQIYFLHSALGILRFGVPFATTAAFAARCFRSFYYWLSEVVDIVPLALLTTDILRIYKVDKTIRLILLSLGIAPVFFQFAIRPKWSQMRKERILINLTATLQSFVIAVVGLQNGNYSVLSLIISHMFERFLVEEICYRYEIPYTDFTQYCLCFVEIFMCSTLLEI